MNIRLLIMVYKDIIESISQYGIVVWGDLYDAALNPMKVVQYISKVFFWKDVWYPTSQLYSADVLSGRMLYFYKNCTNIFKNGNLKIPISHKYGTRQITMYVLYPSIDEMVNQRFVRHMAPKIYNTLIIEIKHIINILFYLFLNILLCYLFYIFLHIQM